MTESAQPFADVADDARVSETPLVAKGFALRSLTCIYIFVASPPSIAESLRSERPPQGQENETAMRPHRDREVPEETRHWAKPNCG